MAILTGVSFERGRSVRFQVAENDGATSRSHSGKIRIPALTGIRGVAALYVFTYHFWPQIARFGDLTGRPFGIRSGWLGVDLFFILSGFVLYLNYGKGMSSDPKRGIWKFALGRITRILPLNAVVLTSMLLAVTTFPDLYWGEGPFTFASWAACLFLVQSWVHRSMAWNAPAWSLSAEWLSYFLFAASMPALARIRANRTVLCLMALLLCALFGMVLTKQPQTLDRYLALGLVRCALEFTLGCLLCILGREPISASHAISTGARL